MQRIVFYQRTKQQLERAVAPPRGRCLLQQGVCSVDGREKDLIAAINVAGFGAFGHTASAVLFERAETQSW